MPKDSFEIDKACYEQNFTQMRSLNEQMIKIPQVAVTITGGLWFVVGSADSLSEEVAFIFLLFTWIVNFCLGASCLRIRDVMESYMEKIHAFSEKNYASGSPQKPKSPFLKDYSMIKIYIFLMCIAGLLSLFIALRAYYPFEMESEFQQCIKTLVSIVLYSISALCIWLLLFKPTTK